MEESAGGEVKAGATGGAENLERVRDPDFCESRALRDFARREASLTVKFGTHARDILLRNVRERAEHRALTRKAPIQFRRDDEREASAIEMKHPRRGLQSESVPGPAHPAALAGGVHREARRVTGEGSEGGQTLGAH